MKKRFSWLLALSLAILHFLAVVFLLFLVLFNALFRMIGGFGAALAGARQADHRTTPYEIAIQILLQPLDLFLRLFNQPMSMGLVAVNSLIWGMVLAALIGLARGKRPEPRPPSEPPIIE